jgi:hypothetical protein
MTVKLDHQPPAFNPDQFKGQETHDPLGSYISRSHRIVEEHMRTPDGQRVWGVECVKCKHGYIVTDGQRSKARQPCRCDSRK